MEVERHQAARDFEAEQLTMDQAREALEAEEREARAEVSRIATEQRIRTEEREEERIREGERKNELETDIAALKRELRRREESLRKLEECTRKRDVALQKMEEDLQLAMDIADTMRRARISVTREADDLPHAQSLRYSRKCAICMNDNPRKRVVMTECGHITCATCAEEVAHASGFSTMSCPICRTSTAYVNLYEDLATPEARKQALQARKRKRISGPNEEYLC